MKQIVVVAGVIRENGRLLLAKRLSSSSEGDKWEFPGGKVEWGEDPRQALQRELYEELKITVDVMELLDAVSHINGETHLLLLYFECRIREGSPTPVECQQVGWFESEAVSALEMPPADRRFWIWLGNNM